MLVGAAVNRSRLLSIDGLYERAFTLAFSGLVYPQIWEDPEVDLTALELTPDSRVVTIASGGCNMMSYLVAGPAHIAAVDLNTAHVALNRMKLVAARHVPDHIAFFALFGNADDKANVATFDAHVAPHLDEESRAFWNARDWRGRRRVSTFARNFYQSGLLGRFIRGGHLLARLHGADAGAIMTARSPAEQREIYERELLPLFESRFVKWLIARPASLFGLGIPPAQYRALAGDKSGGISEVLKQRLERLACGFPLQENYFARQAFGSGYGGICGGDLPPYLKPENFAALKENLSRASVHHVSFTDYLAGSPDACVDRYVLLDAQDWMSDDELQSLWRQVNRTARAGARVIFRTAAEPSLLPGRVPEEILARWEYRAEASSAFTARDRSAIYGGFHLYVFKG